ncbi:heparinase II/III domain-containing protein [Membranihabitans maritimus]|uniref:heparinase II/III domain-containing protein n=1 Tax=Membranihabitans maritimus TaxID=2904244 RepID=UPI001F278FFB|nr:heparinase II/III family protein [Membranihabitans maritimus]
MKKKYKRRQFLGQLTVGSGLLMSDGFWKVLSKPGMYRNEPLFDWSLWKKYRETVKHPCLTIKPVDIENAHRNIEKYKWARNYSSNIEKTAKYYLPYIEGESLNTLITKTTPGHSRMTPCPACRDKNLPNHPGGFWIWDIDTPEELKCEVCNTIFPNKDYPETIHLHATWGAPQTISYFGGEPFEIFGFKKGRPSFSANIRARKVRWAANYSRLLAEAYVLTDQPQYADACRKILLRLATCYPNWMVHVGYGEFADMDPKIASLRIKDLPEDELTPPPNKPDRQLWTGYWSAGRSIGRGFEATFVRKVVEAYDLTCSAYRDDRSPVYSNGEKIQIEKDLLLESTILLVCDKGNNNKSINNRPAVGLVGMCVGHPELVRFGLEGFEKATKEWFLKDGTTKESPFYGLMALGGIWDLAQTMRDYSDPHGFTDINGNRIDGKNLYEEPAYQQIWEAFYKGLRGDLTYPPFADSFHNLILDPSYLELMVANYPENKLYLSLLKKACGTDLSLPTGPVPDSYFEEDIEKVKMMTLAFPYDLSRASSPSSFSLYYRKPKSVDRYSPPIQFTDWNPPNLRIGHLRTGKYGRESLLLLNASHWRGHNHSDSLNLYYWKNGSEILSDFGYLWDHPQKKMSSRTLAHNTVLIDEKDQISVERGGNMRHFSASTNVKMMEAESSAYMETSLYRRTTAIIDHGKGRNYIIDFFRVRGGDIQDYVFHLDTLNFETSTPSSWSTYQESLYDFDKVQNNSNKGSWQLIWTAGENMKSRGWMLSHPNETSFIGRGWGQKDWENSDFGAKATYIVRRSRGKTLKTFVSVFEGSDSGEFFIRNVSYDTDQNLLIIDTNESKDYIMSALDYKKLEVPVGSKSEILEGHFAAVSVRDDEILFRSSVQP